MKHLHRYDRKSARRPFSDEAHWMQCSTCQDWVLRPINFFDTLPRVVVEDTQPEAIRGFCFASFAEGIVVVIILSAVYLTFFRS